MCNAEVFLNAFDITEATIFIAAGGVVFLHTIDIVEYGAKVVCFGCVWNCYSSMCV